MGNLAEGVRADESISVLSVVEESDADDVEPALRDDEGMTLQTETDAMAAVERLDDTDCVVGPFDPPTLDDDLITAVRNRDERLPVVLYTTEPIDAVADRLSETAHVEYVQKGPADETVTLLAGRIRTLVERRQLRAANRRFVAALDSCPTPTLIADPTGTIEYSNGQLASTVSHANSNLCGRAWTEIFTDEAARHLQYEAVPVGTDGWTWSGETVLDAGTEDGVSARTSLIQLPDSSKVFVFDDLERLPAEC